jgi:DNA repair protein RadC
MLMYRCSGTQYTFDRPITRHELLRVAEEAIAADYARGEAFTDPKQVMQFFALRLAGLPNERFDVAFLDSRLRLIAVETLFNGTIDGCEIHPRVVVTRALTLNAAALVLAHQHPSGDATPSAADRAITARLREALALVDVRVLDHIVVGATPVSMAAMGLM